MSIVKHKDHMMKFSTDGSTMKESGGSSGHQLPFPEWWDNLPPTVKNCQTTAPYLHARRLFNQKKCQSWAEYVSKLSADTPIKPVWDTLRKYLAKIFALPPKQYITGKNGTSITDPKYIANEHATSFTANSSSAHYSATFQAIKEQEEKGKIDFTSGNTEVYNKLFRLRDLRGSVMKTKPRAPGTDGIHDDLLKHLPVDTLKILQEILNKIRISGDSPHQWRAATMIPIPNQTRTHSVIDIFHWPAAYAGP